MIHGLETRDTAERREDLEDHADLAPEYGWMMRRCFAWDRDSSAGHRSDDLPLSGNTAGRLEAI